MNNTLLAILTLLKTELANWYWSSSKWLGILSEKTFSRVSFCYITPFTSDFRCPKYVSAGERIIWANKPKFVDTVVIVAVA